MFELDDAPESVFALEVISAGAAQTVCDDGRIGLIVEAVGEQARSVLLDHFAVVVVEVGNRFASRIVVRRHAPGQALVILKAALLAAVASKHGGQLTARAVFVANQRLFGQNGMVRVA